MKRCPTCQKTFADSMRFCQIDGTPLDEETIESGDPYKTTVGGAPPRFEDDEDLLQISDKRDSTDTLISSGGENSKFNQTEDDVKNDASPFDSPTMPISSPFDLGYQPPNFGEPTSLKEPDSPFGASQSPFNQSPFEQNQDPFGQQIERQWSPPPAPEADWQDQNIGANTPFQPPVVGLGQNKTLAVVSLVCGILSLTCCGPFTGIAALITGFMAKNNVDANPQQYDGRGLAIAGMIMGGISLVLTVLWVIFAGLGSIFG
ncbi:MAG TPA: DUF4190 domain-containing protein [Pyrinomonadaceae bacterium]|nr:DUF4190 domain-containing protein [Pyrinomonadaceae bacterium]